MNKEEILKYVSENYEMPQDAMQYSNDIEFCMEMLKVEPSIIDEFPIEVQKQILLSNDEYLEETDIRSLFEDAEFAKKLVDKNNDILLRLRGLPIDNEYIKELTIAYIKGEKVPAKGSRLERMNTRLIYLSSIKAVQEDHELVLYLISQNIDYLPDLKDSTIRDNPEYINEYVKKNPHTFPKYVNKISNSLTPEVIQAVLKYDFQNYKLIDENNPIIVQCYKSIERIREFRPELKMDNPNLRYELLCDSDFINMDINIINSLLEYNTGNVDKIIEIKNSGNLEYLIKYIEQYNSLYGNSLENIQNAISSFEQMKQLLINTNNFEGISIDESKIKTIIATGNKFKIENIESLLKYDKIVKEYYANKLQEATSIEEIKKIYTEMLFNASPEELEKFDEEYCNFNIDELDEYAKRNKLDSPIDEDFRKRQELYKSLKDIQDIDELRRHFDDMPITICDIEEKKKNISIMYSKSYNNEMLDLKDETLEHQDYQGVDVIKLNGQKFNICIHRIFNFDFNMNSSAREIVANPERWNLIEGSNTVSTTLITDKKIAAIFRPLKTSKGTEMMGFTSKEEADEFSKAAIEESRKICEGEKLQEIDKDAVFYGFTEVLSAGIIKMNSTDMMVEHGKGHLETKSSNCRLRDSEDLAYWTSPDYWNEVVQKRKETDVDKANELRKQKRTDRMQPSCIVCFDENINEQSLLAARVHNIPILMLDRQAYLDINRQRLEMARLDFSKSLSPQSIREIFYRQPYHKVVQDMPELINEIRSNNEVSVDDKKMSMEYLAYLGQHFIEQSSGYIIDVPVEEYNKKMQEYIQTIDRELSGQDLVTMDDMKSAYLEISANDRIRRYEALKSDIRELNFKEGEKIHE